MQKVNLSPTVDIVDGEKIVTFNTPIYIYDTGGPYTNSRVKTNSQRGIEKSGSNGLLDVRRMVCQ